MTDAQLIAAIADECRDTIRLCLTSALPHDSGAASQAVDILALIQRHRESTNTRTAAQPAHVATTERR